MEFADVRVGMVSVYPEAHAGLRVETRVLHMALSRDNIHQEQYFQIVHRYLHKYAFPNIYKPTGC
jgi:hypothetical protein